MRVIYLPIYKASVSYTVSTGRRWSILEQMLLIELASQRHSLSTLASISQLPERLVVEALINLVRYGWVEVRSTAEETLFAATATGKRNAALEELQPVIQQRQKWMSLSMDRITSSWFRTEDLDPVHEKDVEEDAFRLPQTFSTLKFDDPGVRSLVRLERNEGFEGFAPGARNSGRFLARILIDGEDIVSGLPAYASSLLRSRILAASADAPEVEVRGWTMAKGAQVARHDIYDTITERELVVGGAEQRELVRRSLETAHSYFVLHSCFLDAPTLEGFLPDLERAARRGVRIDLLWGVRHDPESSGPPKPFTDCQNVLSKLSMSAKPWVTLSEKSSGFHSKAIIFDNRTEEGWSTIVSSCNFLSSDFSAIEVSVRLRHPRIGRDLIGCLISSQVEASGAWSQLVHRLNRTWNELNQVCAMWSRPGVHKVEFLTDHDHYDCIRRARDLAKTDIVLGCDLFGIAAETSVLVPLSVASEEGREVRLFFRRPSRKLKEDGRQPDLDALAKRGLITRLIPSLHAKFLLWDEEALGLTSFNWLATVANDQRKGAEIGILLQGPGLRTLFAEKLLTVSGGTIDIRRIAVVPSSTIAVH